MLQNDPTPLSQIRKITLNNPQNFVIDLSNTSTEPDLLSCKKILRCLPGKRISCIAEYRNTIVFAKIFIDPNRAKIHWQREKKGIELLNKNKILSPELIANILLEDSAGILVFEFQENAVDFYQEWKQSNAGQQRKLLNQLLSLIAEHHNKNIIQQDLHLNNFIFKNADLYTLDGSEIIEKKQLDENTALNNLALLFAQFYPNNDVNIASALSVYLQQRNQTFSGNPINSVKRLTQQKREQRKHKFIEKTTRECSALVVSKTWRQYSICDRDYYNGNFSALIKDPELFCQQARVIKKGNTSTVFDMEFQGVHILIKRYNIKNWRHRLNRAIRQSRAMNSWINAHLLTFYGIKTAKPIAIIENRFGLLKGRAYLITQYLTSDTCENYFTTEDLDGDRKDMAGKITRLLTGLADLFIAHGDLKASNILISEGQPYLIDLDAMKQYGSKKNYARAGKKDWQRFQRNWEKDKTIAGYFTRTDDL